MRKKAALHQCIRVVVKRKEIVMFVMVATFWRMLTRVETFGNMGNSSKQAENHQLAIENSFRCLLPGCTGVISNLPHVNVPA
jgi:hypothetical protein